MTYCICGQPADIRAQLTLTAELASRTTRVWGGSELGHIHLCELCMWQLENAAGDAIVKEIAKIEAIASKGVYREAIG